MRYNPSILVTTAALVTTLIVIPVLPAQAEKGRSEEVRQDYRNKHRPTPDKRYSVPNKQTHPNASRRDRWAPPSRPVRPTRPSRPEYRDNRDTSQYHDRSTNRYDRSYRNEHVYRLPPRHDDRAGYQRHRNKVIVIPSRRYYDRYIRVRPFRHSYPYYRRVYVDDHFWGWLGFTAITLHVLDYLNEDQRRQHELAMYRASRAPIGETIYWADSNHVTGSVTPVWEGPSEAGQYCREYQHEVTIDDRAEVAYGTACRMPDGTWEVVH